MTIEKNLNAKELTVKLTGRLDTVTAPQLETELKESLEGVENLVLDFGALDYLSSAGLHRCGAGLCQGHSAFGAAVHFPALSGQEGIRHPCRDVHRQGSGRRLLRFLFRE